MSDETVTWRVRPSETQKFFVLEFLEQHPQLVTSRRSYEGSSNANTRRELWYELTEKLNNMGHAYKTVETWQKYWRDQRAFVRERHAALSKLKSNCNNSRKLRNRIKPLNNYERRVLALIMPEQTEYFVVKYIDSDNDNLLNPKLEVDDEHCQLNMSCGTSKKIDHSTIKQSPQSSPTPPTSSYPCIPNIQMDQPPSPPASTSSSIPNIQVKSIRTLLSEDQKQTDRRNGNGKRIRLERELERKTIALLEKNEEFNRELEIKKLEVEKEKVAALKELITVVRLGFACMAGQQLK